jgi:hypothetical protein
MSSWRNDIQAVVKKCRNLALYFFPQVSNRCRMSGQRGYRVHVDHCISILSLTSCDVVFYVLIKFGCVFGVGILCMNHI